MKRSRSYLANGPTRPMPNDPRSTGGAAPSGLNDPRSTGR
jgi:hypothetical protein